jgi:hypothetical protein
VARLFPANLILFFDFNASLFSLTAVSGMAAGLTAECPKQTDSIGGERSVETRLGIVSSISGSAKRAGALSAFGLIPWVLPAKLLARLFLC